MNEKPILFSGPMVRAILDGTKTQDRRVIKLAGRRPEFCGSGGRDGPDWNDPTCWGWEDADHGDWVTLKREAGQRMGWLDWAGAYQPGMKLWVRETFCYSASGGYDAKPGFDMETGANSIWYRATDDGQCEGPWRPSIYMPRWASRITLLVKEVRAERLREISDNDCREEGIHSLLANDGAYLRGAFGHLWDSINGKRPGCSWADNPWVAAISFEVMR